MRRFNLQPLQSCVTFDVDFAEKEFQSNDVIEEGEEATQESLSPLSTPQSEHLVFAGHGFEEAARALDEILSFTPESTKPIDFTILKQSPHNTIVGSLALSGLLPLPTSHCYFQHSKGKLSKKSEDNQYFIEGELIKVLRKGGALLSDATYTLVNDKKDKEQQVRIVPTHSSNRIREGT